MTGLLGTLELADLRRACEQTLTDTCTIARLNVAVGSTPCRLENPLASVSASAALAEQQVPASAWTLHFPITANVKHGDYITTGGRTFELTVPFGPESEELLRVISCVEVTNA